MTYEEYKKKKSQNNDADTSSGKISYADYRKKTTAKRTSAFRESARKYLDDYRNFATSAANDSRSMNWGNAAEMQSSRVQTAADLRRRGESLALFLEANKGAFAETDYNEITSAISASRQGVEDVMSYFGDSTRYYSGFRTEDDYRTFLTQKEQLSADTAALTQQIGQMRNLLTRYKDLTTREISKADEAELAQMRKQYATAKDLEKAIKEKESYLEGAKTLQAAAAKQKNEAGWREKYAGLSYTELMSRAAALEDGDERAWITSYAPTTMTQEDTDTEYAKVKQVYDQLSAALEQYQYGDRFLLGAEGAAATEQFAAEYGSVEELKTRIEDLRAQMYRLENASKYNFLSENADFTEKSTYQGASASRLQNLVNSPDSTAQRDWLASAGKYLEPVTGNIYGALNYENLQHMTDDERKAFNYLYNTKGEDAAKEYLDYLQASLNERSMTGMMEKVSDLTRSAPVLSHAVASFLSTPINLLGGDGLLDAAGQKAVADITGEYKPVDYNRDSMFFPRVAGTIRGTVTSDIANATGVIDFDEEEHPILSKALNGKSLGDVYQLGMSMQDSVAVVGLSMIHPALGQVGTALLGGTAGTQAMLDAVERGASDEQAITLGIVSGVAEMVFEKYELESLLGQSDEIIKSIFKQAASEAVGEGATEIANIAADFFIMADKSNWMQSVEQYMAEGKNQTQAHLLALLDANIQTTWAGIGGALMGGIMGGGMSAVRSQAKKAQREAGLDALAALQVGNDLPGLIAEALELDPKNSLALKMQKQLNGGEQVSARDIRTLMEETAQKQDTKMSTDTAAQLLNEYGETGDITSLSAAVAKQATGGKLTRAEQRLIDQSQHGKKAVDELNSRMKQLRDTPATQPAQPTQENADTVDTMDTSEETASQGGYEASADGRTIRKSTGETVTIKGVASIKGKEMTLRLEDGSEVSASDVAYGSEDEALVYESVAKMGVEADAANVLIGTFFTGKVSADVFARGIQEAYLYGVYNIPVQEMMARGAFSLDLTDHQRKVAYELGQMSAGKRIARQHAAKRRPKGSGQNITDGKVHFDGDRTKLNEMQKSSLSVMEVLAKSLGVQFYVFESWEENGVRYYRDSNGEKAISPNGWYDPSDGSIHIDLYAGNDGKGTMLFTVAHELSHELSHFIRQWSPAKFKVLANLVLQQYGEQNIPVRELIDKQIAKAKRHGRTIGFDEAYEEVVADSMEAILADGYVVQLMADMRAQDKTLWEKVRDWFKDLAQKLQAAVDAFRGVEPDSVEGKLVSEMQDMIVILESFYTDALMDASENYAARAQKNTAEGGGVKYQARKNGSMDDAEIQAVQGIGEKSIFAFNANDIANTSMLAKRYWNEMGTRSPFFRAWFGDWRGKDTTPIRIATKKGVTKNQPQFNNDTHWVINISGKIFDENKVHHTVSNREAKPYMPYLDEIVQNAVLLDTWGADPKSPNTLLMHSMYAVADIGNGPEVLKLYVEEMNDPAGSKTGKRAYSLQNIEKAFATRKRVQGNSPSSSANVPNAIRTVADLHTAVKIYDKNFTPKPASEVVNADGTPKIVYHGTNAERFSIFSYGHIGSGTGVGVLGDGFYFTDKKNLAKNYGRNVYECYIKMKKPYYATGADAYKLSVNKLKAQGYDGVILGAPAGTVYMVFDNTQIKSATDNIGTFDGTNPDIRYSTRAQTDPKTQHQLEQENESLREDVKYLREMLALQRKVTGGTKFTKTSVLAAARVLKQYAGAKGDTAELAGLLNAFYEGIATAQELTWEGVQEMAQPVVSWLQDHVDLKPRRSEYAQEILSAIRGRKIYLDESQIAEAAYRFGSYDAFRKSLLGSITLSKSADMSLDSFWHEMSAQYPDVFSEDVNSSDMPGALFDAIASLRNSDTSAIEYAHNRDMIARDLLWQVYDSYWNISTLRTVADSAQKKINALKGKHIRQMSELRAKKNAQISQLKAAHRAELEAVRKEHRKDMDERIAAIKKKYQDSRDAAVDGRRRTQMRHKIQRVVKELNSLLLSDDKKRHVPDSMKKAVASALDLLKLDTVNAEERLADYDVRIANETDPITKESLIETRERIRQQGENIGERLKELHAAYADIIKSEDPDVSAGYDPVIEGNLLELMETIGKTPFSKLSLEQLEDVYSMYRMVLTRVRDANKSFISQKNETISQRGAKVVREVRAVGGVHKLLPGSGAANAFMWNNLKPVYAIEKLGSPELKAAFWALMEAEGGYARDIQAAADFAEKMRKEYGYDQWDMDKKYKFTSTSGIDFELTLEQIMSLYAFSRRDQAMEHLRVGGFVFDNSIETYKETEDPKTGKKKRSVIKYRVNSAEAHQLSTEILTDIISTLDTRQAAFVEKMQDYLSTTMGAKGNEVSMAMYGIKLFKERYYFPLKSSKQFLFEQNEVAGEVRIKNSGFTKKTKPHAKNPIILRNFMDVWAGHVHDMSMYHAFTLPLEDFNRIFNFTTHNKEGMAQESVKSTIQNAYGAEAVQYVQQMIVDLNGGARSDNREAPGKRLMSRFKKAAVAGSLSVAIQQPSALNRAKAMIGDKYFLTLNPKLLAMGRLWEECKTYAPVAIIKEMGKFDMDTGLGTISYIRADKNSLMDWVDTVTGWMPAKADEWAWVQIWAAVKKEIAATQKDLDVGSEEFMQAAGRRFTEVIAKTQVYDSTLSRSANMRSKSGLMQMATAFMAEPTTSINMVQDAIWQFRRGYRRQATKTVRAVLDSMIANAVLVSLIYALRDDDEDETFAEKYASALTTELIDGANPLTYIPWVKDLWSIAQGFDVERSDMSLAADLYDSLQKAAKLFAKDTEGMTEEEEKAVIWQRVEACWGIVDIAASFFGVPVKNVRRDIMAAVNTIENGRSNAERGIRNTTGSFWSEVGEAVRKTIPVLGWESQSKADKLYSAISSGDTSYIERLKKTYVDDEGKFNESSYTTAVRKGLRENDARIRQAAKAKLNKDFNEYRRLILEIVNEGHFKRKDVVAAIDTEFVALKKK